MRLESMEAWQSRADLAILISVFGGLAVSAYALLQLVGVGLASPACLGGGCETRLAGINAHYEAMLEIALLGTVGLVAWLISVRRSLGKRIQELRPPTLPVATAVTTSDRERAAGHPD